MNIMKGINRTNKKHGFTLAELLIVVAIIGVLVGIYVPIINKQIEKAREAHDIYTMRTAASAAISLYYAGVSDEKSAQASGLKWWQNDGKDQANAAGVYDPKTGKFHPIKSDDAGPYKCGKGTKTNAGTNFTMGNSNGAYAPGEDYTDAALLVSIYPLGNNKHVDVYWKHTEGKDTKGKYVGGQTSANNPKYSIRVPLS